MVCRSCRRTARTTRSVSISRKIPAADDCQCAAAKATAVYGDGLNVRDWLYVKDHCAAVRLVLQKGRPGETYNIGGNNEMLNLEVVKLVCALLDRAYAERPQHALLMQFVADRPGHDRRYAIDASKIRSELGWRPRESFESGLQKTIDWYLTNQEWMAGMMSGAYREWISLNYGARQTL